MKKLFNLFAAALVVLAAVSCEKSDVLPDSDVITLTATIDNGGTKTVLGSEVDSEGNYPVYWSEDDKIAVIQQVDDEINIYEFTLSSGCEGRTNGTFTCLENEAVGFDVKKEYFAIYPASIVTGTSFAGIKLNIPQEQSYASNSFGLGAMPMYAVCAGNNELTFSNLMGAMKLQLKGSSDIKIASIKVESWIDSNQSAKWTLSGDANCSIGTGKINFSSSSSSNLFDNVSLVCGDNGVSLSDTDKGVAFMIALPSQNNNNQFFKVTITAANGQTKEITATTANVIKAGMILEMPVVDCSELNPQPVTYAYIENGVYLGEGVAIPCKIGEETKTLIWAPVNCGYHPVDYPYGKLYQWGRKDGQGYAPYDNGNGSKDNGASAKFSNEDLPETLAADTFYSKWSATEWTEENNPCPAGWRVPTLDDVKGVKAHYSNMVSVNSLSGRWICGDNEYIEGMPNAIFLYAAGVLYAKYGTANCNGKGLFRGSSGHYYTSTLDNNNGQAYRMRVNGSNGVYFSSDGNKSNACSVRCVKDAPQASSFSNN